MKRLNVELFLAALIALVLCASCAKKTDVTPATSSSSQSGSPPPNQTPIPTDHSTAKPPTPSDELSQIDKVLASLPMGNMAFNVPAAVEIGQTFSVRLILSPTKSIAQIQEELDRSLPPRQSHESAQVRLTSQMEARMTGQNFEIVEVTPEILAVSGSEDTQWTWDVTPKQGGPQQLHLTVSAILYLNGQSTPRVVNEFDRKINVNVGFGYRVSSFIGDNWQWLWATLLVPAVGWLWRRRKKNHN